MKKTRQDPVFELAILMHESTGQPFDECLIEADRFFVGMTSASGYIWRDSKLFDACEGMDSFEVLSDFSNLMEDFYHEKNFDITAFANQQG